MATDRPSSPTTRTHACTGVGWEVGRAIGGQVACGTGVTITSLPTRSQDDPFPSIQHREASPADKEPGRAGKEKVPTRGLLRSPKPPMALAPLLPP